MRFHAEHHFSAPVAAVIGLLVDPAFHRELELPDVELVDVVDSGTDGDESRLVLRYRFVGQLDLFARRLLGRRELTWVQDLRIDGATGAGRLMFQADADARRFHGSADVTVEPDGDGTPDDGGGTADGGDATGSLRRVDGELIVAVPVIGGRAERQIVPGLLRRLDIETAAVEERLATV